MADNDPLNQPGHTDFNPLTVKVVQFLGAEGSGPWADFMKTIKEMHETLQKLPQSPTLQDTARETAQAAYRTGASSATTPGVLQAPGSSGVLLDQFGRPMPMPMEPQSTSTEGGPSTPTDDVIGQAPFGSSATLRALLSRSNRQYWLNTGGRSPVGGVSFLTDEENEDAFKGMNPDYSEEGHGPPGGTPPPTEGGGPSTPPSSGSPAQTPQAFAQQAIQQMGPATVPRAGEWTGQNVFEMLSRWMTGRAANTDPNNPQAAQWWLGGAMKAQDIAQQVMPQVSIAHQYLGQVGAYAGALQQYGSSLGTLPSEGAVDIGPARVFDPTMLKGLTTAISDKFQAAISPGLSTEQIQQIRENLAQGGYYEGPQAAQYNTALRGLTQFAPQIGTSPTTVEQLNQTVRYGTMSLSQFIQTMKQIPDAAKVANVSFDEMQQAMSQFGEMNQQRGGTFATGMQLAQEQATNTGLPPEQTQGLLTSPWAQGYIMTQTGIPPWAQGTLPPAMQSALSWGGLQQAIDFSSGITGQTINVPGFGKTRLSQASQQAAYLQGLGLYPDVSPEVLQHAIQDKGFAKRVQMSSYLDQGMYNWSAKAGTLTDKAGQGNENAQKQLYKMIGNTQQIRKDLTRAIDPNTGQRIFQHGDIEKITAAGGLQGKQNWMDWLNEGDQQGIRNKLIQQHPDWFNSDGTTDVNLTHKQYQTLRGETMKYQASDVYNKYKDIKAQRENDITNSANSSSDNNTVIQLSPAAQKFFYLTNPSKASANAGSGVPVNYNYGSRAGSPSKPAAPSP